jgi:RHS repeat-associated protein
VGPARAATRVHEDASPSADAAGAISTSGNLSSLWTSAPEHTRPIPAYFNDDKQCGYRREEIGPIAHDDLPEHRTGADMAEAVLLAADFDLEWNLRTSPIHGPRCPRRPHDRRVQDPVPQALGDTAVGTAGRCSNQVGTQTPRNPSSGTIENPLHDAAVEATEVPFEGPLGMDPLEKRLLADARIRYWADDLSGPLAYGSTGKRALIYDTDTKAMSEDQFTAVFGGLAEAPDATVMENEGGYVLDDDAYWMRSGRHVPSASKFYQPVEFLDPFGNSTTVTYDADALFMVEIEDPIGNTVSAEIDRRVLAPAMMTDPNGNRVAVAFDTRGVVVKSAVMGKEGGSDGDTLLDPTSTFEYDLFTWSTDQQPLYAKTRARETHGDIGTRWLESYAYFDGAGRTRMTKTQAAPGLAPERDVNGELVLDGGLPVLVDTSPVRWIGNGRTVFDNKGNAVKQYEPYFSSVPDYEDEAELVEQGVTPVLHYDPLGRLTRTELPNGTESRIEFDAWSQVAHDPNDLVAGSDWYTSRIDYVGADVGLLAEKRAAVLAYAHRDTPTTTNLDSQGRPFRVAQHNGLVDDVPVLHVTKSVLDVRGNVLEVLYYLYNELLDVTEERSGQETVHGMLGQPLKTLSTDAGNRVLLASVLGEPIRAWNDRGFITRAVYDAARRPTQQWVKPGVGAEELVTFNVYGEQVAAPDDSNLRGQLYRSYDSAGALTAELFDFKGNLLRQNRHVAEDYTTTPDWADLADAATLDDIVTAAAALLESESFTTATTYDAFGRVKTQKTPDDSETEHIYDEGGRLQAVQSKLRGAATATEFIEQIEYDAKGQRQRVEFANDTTTIYSYDPSTFRVTRIKTDRSGVNAATMQDLKYTYDPAGNIVEIRDDAQQTVYFSNAVVDPRQRYEYDAVYRLIWAEGRETPNGQSDHTELVPSPSPPPNDASAVVTYIEEYIYDEVGNIRKMRHTATGNNWTRYYQYASDSNRLDATSLPGDAAEGPYTGTYTHDEHGNMTTMPHLSDGINWDYADRMQVAHHGDGGTTYYVYDGAGQRVRKIRLNAAETTSKERLYFGDWEIYRERHNINTTPVLDLERATLHVHDDTGRMCLVETKIAEDDAPIVDPANIARYQYANHLGTASLELNGNAEIISYEEFHPFGTSSFLACNGSIEVNSKRYRYTGQERDAETGLAYHRDRYYAPWLGRWTASDALGIAGGLNRFEYGRSNPVKHIDDDGNSPWDPQALRISRSAIAAELQIPIFRSDVVKKEYRQATKDFEKLGLPTKMLERVLDSNVDIVKGEANEFVPGFWMDRLRLRSDALMSAHDIVRGRADSIAPAVSFYHESAHAILHLQIERHKNFIEKGVKHFKDAPLSNGKTSLDPSRLFQESVATYVGARVESYLKAYEHLLRAANPLVPIETARMHVQTAKDLLSNRPKASGYEYADGKSEGAEVTTSRDLTDEMKDYIDDRILTTSDGGRLPRTVGSSKVLNSLLDQAKRRFAPAPQQEAR